MLRWGGEVETLLGLVLIFVGNPRDMLQCKRPWFSSENIALEGGLYSHWFRAPKDYADG